MEPPTLRPLHMFFAKPFVVLAKNQSATAYGAAGTARGGPRHGHTLDARRAAAAAAPGAETAALPCVKERQATEEHRECWVAARVDKDWNAQAAWMEVVRGVEVDVSRAHTLLSWLHGKVRNGTRKANPQGAAYLHYLTVDRSLVQIVLDHLIVEAAERAGSVAHDAQ
eukprot:CAMPEP_0174720718 /NCGR_PEP_ID=MMETSP1094-20130205/34286_1 /TAXON_ID=156173 /ORGANISM="Chrysochromulina brevifilum, Strain UTEX LB 985" /LENGTH=167 /DNA_ID=CAMNT_0015921249 /DNA_START=140 /DNA_END=643 /DNA_ORIENTATION=-